VQYGDYYRKSATLPAKQLLSLKERPTAIFAASDDMALEVIEIAKQMNIKVPQDLSVIGFDDSPLAINAPVPLTTVRQPLSEIGAKAVEILHQQLSQNKTVPIKLLLPTQLIERESCRKIS
jgi:LacI family transcriptional regulator